MRHTGTPGYGIENGGLCIRGYFVNGKLNGIGAINVYNSKGEMIYTIVADFTDGVPNGFASIVYSDGENFSYTGEVKMGIYHGFGTFVDHDSNVSWQGEWVDGEFIVGAFDDTLNNISLSGYFENGLLQGLGGMSVNWDSYWGDFVDGQMIALLGSRILTDEERASRNALLAQSEAWAATQVADSMNRMNIMVTDSQNRTRQMNQDLNRTNAELTARLINAQPPPRVYHVPTYGLSRLERARDGGWIPSFIIVP